MAGGFAPLAGSVGERAAPEPAEVGDRGVADHAPVKPQPFGLSLLWREAEPGTNGQIGPAGREAAAADLDFPRLRWVQAVDEAQELRTTRTDQPGQAEDLALAQRERGVVDVRGAGQSA